MIDLRVLRIWLKNAFELTDKNLIIKRKKKMALVKTANGVKTKRINYIRIEIIE